MSFDFTVPPLRLAPASLNPFGTGQCLSTENDWIEFDLETCLNPFGTGQCLSTGRIW